MRMGTPYPTEVWNEERRGVDAICPVCGESIPLLVQKDFESMTGEEYRAHYEKEHGE